MNSSFYQLGRNTDQNLPVESNNLVQNTELNVIFVPNVDKRATVNEHPLKWTGRPSYVGRVVMLDFSVLQDTLVNCVRPQGTHNIVEGSIWLFTCIPIGPSATPPRCR